MFLFLHILKLDIFSKWASLPSGNTSTMSHCHLLSGLNTNYLNWSFSEELRRDPLYSASGVISILKGINIRQYCYLTQVNMWWYLTAVFCDPIFLLYTIWVGSTFAFITVPDNSVLCCLSKGITQFPESHAACSVIWIFPQFGLIKRCTSTQSHPVFQCVFFLRFSLSCFLSDIRTFWAKSDRLLLNILSISYL